MGLLAIISMSDLVTIDEIDEFSLFLVYLDYR